MYLAGSLAVPSAAEVALTIRSPLTALATEWAPAGVAAAASTVEVETKESDRLPILHMHSHININFQ